MSTQQSIYFYRENSINQAFKIYNIIKSLNQSNEFGLLLDTCEYIELNQKTDQIAKNSLLTGHHSPNSLVWKKDGEVLLNFTAPCIIGRIRQISLSIAYKSNKIYALVCAVNSEYQKLFSHEISVLEKLGKNKYIPHIKRFVPVQFGGTFYPRHFYMQQYYNAGSLLDVIQRVELTKEQQLKLALDVLKGLSFVHEKGFVHRQITLKNILVQSILQDERIIYQAAVSNFKNATLILNPEYPVGGAPAYFSPERCRYQLHPAPKNLKALGPKDDVWAAACILTQLLYKQHPRWMPILNKASREKNRIAFKRLIYKAHFCMINPESFPKPRENESERFTLYKMFRPNPVDRISSKKALEMISFVYFDHISPFNQAKS